MASALEQAGTRRDSARRLLVVRADAIPLGLSLAHGVALLAMPSWPVIALGILWNSNTVAHYFIHRPYFASRWLNVAFSLYESVLLGIPQSLWRERHLAHHAGRSPRWTLGRQGAVEAAMIAGLWFALALLAPRFLLLVYFPGYVLGLSLCQVHGYFEHARGATSHYGRLYNWLFLNDGYHVEHHARPGAHWTELAAWRAPAALRSRWPATLRWLDWLSLESLERCVLRSRWLQARVLQVHEQAFARLLADLPAIERVTIVGGGLFPRTALILRRLLPRAELTVIDRNAANIATARRMLDRDVRYVHALYDECGSENKSVDLLVVPLSYVGDWRRLYTNPPARAVLIHDWIWRRRGRSAVAAWWLLKRINLVLQPDDASP